MCTADVCLVHVSSVRIYQSVIQHFNPLQPLSVTHTAHCIQFWSQRPARNKDMVC